jgi:sodium-dependent phosphate transporter
VLVCIVFFIPFLYRKLSQEDWTIKWYHFFFGPLLLLRGPVPPRPEGARVKVVQDYYRGHKTKAELEAEGQSRPTVDDIETSKLETHKVMEDGKEVRLSDASDSVGKTGTTTGNGVPLENVDLPAWRRWYMEPFDGAWYLPRNLPRAMVRGFMHGVDKDVVASQKKKSMLSGNLERTHAETEHFDNKTEHMYSFLQVATAMVSSFAHGANDVSNAMGPLSAIYLIWRSNKLSSKAPVPIWIL